MKWLTVIFIIAMIAVSGCTGSRTNLTDKRTVSVKRMHSDINGLYFRNVRAYQEGNELVVSGNVKRQYNSAPRGLGHVDVAIVSPDGEVIKKASAAYSPKVISKRSNTGARFKLRLPVISQDGSTVRVAIHKDMFIEKTNKNEFDCGENATITSD